MSKRVQQLDVAVETKTRGAQQPALLSTHVLPSRWRVCMLQPALLQLCSPINPHTDPAGLAVNRPTCSVCAALCIYQMTSL